MNLVKCHVKSCCLRSFHLPSPRVRGLMQRQHQVSPWWWRSACTETPVTIIWPIKNEQALMLMFAASWPVNNRHVPRAFRHHKTSKFKARLIPTQAFQIAPYTILTSYHKPLRSPPLSFSKKLKNHATSFITLSPSKKTNKPVNSLGHARPCAPALSERKTFAYSAVSGSAPANGNHEDWWPGQAAHDFLEDWWHEDWWPSQKLVKCEQTTSEACFLLSFQFENYCIHII